MGEQNGSGVFSRILDNPELDIECLVKLHKSIDVVVDLVKAAFHVCKVGSWGVEYDY